MAEPYAAWLARDVVGVTGPESAAYLQGQLSQDVLALADASSAWSWVLSPQGKVEALMRVTRLAPDDWLLDTDAGWGEVLLGRLNRFKLRTKIELEPLAWQVLGLRGEGAAGPAGGVAVEPWPGVTGVDLLGPQPAVPEGWPLMEPNDYEAVRVASGIPKMGAELTEKTIPAETGLVEWTASFTKGCYTGQELVARIDSRGGHVPRRLRGLVPAGPIEAGRELVDDEGRPAGTVTSVATSTATGWVALGYVRRGVEVPGTLRAAPDGPEVEVRELHL